MKPDGTPARRLAGLFVVLALFAAGCAPTLAARWQGTGERGEAHFFQFALDLKSKVPTALWLADAGSDTRLAVCGLAKAEDGTVTFRLDADTPALTCDDLKHPMTFRGAFGADVLAGVVMDAGGTVIGRFRAFRARED
jgi:hypothetical protein